MSQLHGDAEALAEFQFRHALAACGECRDYHALWPYRRLAGMVHDADVDAHLIGPLIRAALGKGDRMLIAGAADAGLLALAAAATAGRAVTFDVVDRCATPLAVCRRYMAAHDISGTTKEEDLPSISPDSRYGAILAHSVLQFVPEAGRQGFLQRCKQSLVDGGTLIFAERLQPAKSEENRHRSYPREMLDALAASHIRLPEEEAEFLERLRASLGERRLRLSAALRSGELPALLEAAGYSLPYSEEHLLSRRMTAARDAAPDITVSIVAAVPA
jgi:hypothetical protein